MLFFGLLTALLIPSTGFLGDAIRENLIQISNATPQQNLLASGPDGLATTNTLPGNNGGGVMGTGSNTIGGGNAILGNSLPMNTVQALYNPQTGQIEYKLFDGTGSGVTTTSVEGKDLVDSMKALVDQKGIGEASSTLSSNIIAVADEMMRAGELTPQQHDALLNLANQGMEIGGIESLLEAQLTQFETSQADVNTMMHTQVSWGGEMITVEKLAYKIGCYGNCDLSSGNLPSINNSHPETAQFIDLYQQVAQSGALDDPGMEFLVTQLSTQVVALSDVTEGIFGWTFGSRTGPDVPNTAQEMKYFMGEDVSKITYSNSGTICSSGGGSTSSGSCI